MRRISASEPERHRGGLGSLSGVPPRMAAAHSHNDVEINYVFRGRVSYLHGGRQVTLRAGEAALFWASVPHHLIHSAPGTLYQWLDLPLPWFLQLAEVRQLSRRVLDGAFVRLPRAPRGSGEAERFRAWEQDLRGPDPSGAQRRIALLEIEAWLRRVELRGAAQRSEALSSSGELGRLERMVRYIAEHYTEDLPVSAAAREAGLNPDYAIRLFRRHLGTSIGQHILQQRVTHAQRLLLMTGERVLDIGLASGFGSESAFYAAFARHCGVSPKAYRRRMGRPYPGAAQR